ncbi:MAG: prepilin peptidase [Acidimicrobiia bacterium]|nr:prepilin peptidase [Acidimicrobiia bacterium]
MPVAVTAVCALFGLAVGSFLNVVIWRVPRHESIVHPPSHCPSCDTPIRPYDNIPVVSWLLLRGRCRDCGAGIAPRYPLVEAGTALAFGMVGARFDLTWALPGYLVFTAGIIALSVIDLDTFLLPNRIVYPLAVVSIPLVGLAAAGDGGWSAFGRALAGGAALFGLLLVIHLISPRGMGFGDVKLAFILGIWTGYLGWGEVIVGIFWSFAAGAVIGVGLMVFSGRGRKDPVPFGPFLALGSFAAVIFGRAFLDWYL